MLRLPLCLFLIVGCLASFASGTSAATYPHFWSQRYGDAAGFQAVNGVSTDGAGNIYVIGTFTGTINLGGSPLTSAGGYDIFVAKFNPAGVHQCDGASEPGGALLVGHAAQPLEQQFVALGGRGVRPGPSVALHAGRTAERVNLKAAVVAQHPHALALHRVRHGCVQGARL